MKQLLCAILCLIFLLTVPGCETESGVFGVSRVISPGDQMAAVDPACDLARLLGLSASDKVVAVGLGNNCTIHDASANGSLAYAPFGRVDRGQYGRFVALFQVSDASGALSNVKLLGVIDPRGNLVDESLANTSE